MMSDIPVLHYFEGRGNGEFVRMALAAAGIEWTEKYLREPEDVDKLRNDGLVLYGQVPLLQWKGVNMVQSGPIVRYIARHYNLCGKPGEDFQVDMLCEGSEDFYKPFAGLGFGDDEKTKKEIRERFLPRYMPVFEKVLSNSKSGFLVGDGMTIADVSLLKVFLAMEEVTPDGFTGYPKCTEFLQKMKSHPRMEAYLKSPKRHKPNNPHYVSEVKRILRW